MQSLLECILGSMLRFWQTGPVRCWRGPRDSRLRRYMLCSSQSLGIRPRTISEWYCWIIRCLNGSVIERNLLSCLSMVRKSNRCKAFQHVMPFNARIMPHYLVLVLQSHCPVLKFSGQKSKRLGSNPYLRCISEQHFHCHYVRSLHHAVFDNICPLDFGNFIIMPRNGQKIIMIYAKRTFPDGKCIWQALDGSTLH